MNVYQTKYTCARQISYEVTPDRKVTNVTFHGGCKGNTQAVAKLCEGRDIDELITLLNGIECRMGTSCADQFSKALISYKEKNNL
ncbi:MAG: TIGR03905 family TSCPD domain-containing protein [Clostridia bacterium]|nr:TIGR03905 family TSCPD domain-containing protein [Clostridia bacterium]